MKLECKYIDELIDIRENARQKKDWTLSDKIRIYLDSKHVFIFDTNEGQIVYHRNNETRKSLIDKMKQELRATKLFNAWLFSMNANINHAELV